MYFSLNKLLIYHNNPSVRHVTKKVLEGLRFFFCFVFYLEWPSFAWHAYSSLGHGALHHYRATGCKLPSVTFIYYWQAMHAHTVALQTLYCTFSQFFDMLLPAHVTCIDKLHSGQNPGMYTERADEFLPWNFLTACSLFWVALPNSWNWTWVVKRKLSHQTSDLCSIFGWADYSDETAGKHTCVVILISICDIC